MKNVTLGCDNVGAVPAGRWGLMGGTTTRLEINRDGHGFICGSVWGREPVIWKASENRLCARVERGSGSAEYAVNGNNELVLSNVRGFILVAGTYRKLGENFAVNTDSLPVPWMQGGDTCDE